MKKTMILAAAVILSCTCAFAGTNQRQKMIHMAAVWIAGQAGVAESDKAAFISLYQEYKKEYSDIMYEHTPVLEDEEKNAEQKILNDFDKSERILQLRKSYYYKFRTILSPTQIQKMYNAERAAVTGASTDRTAPASASPSHR